MPPAMSEMIKMADNWLTFLCEAVLLMEVRKYPHFFVVSLQTFDAYSLLARYIFFCVVAIAVTVAASMRIFSSSMPNHIRSFSFFRSNICYCC